VFCTTHVLSKTTDVLQKQAPFHFPWITTLFAYALYLGAGAQSSPRAQGSKQDRYEETERLMAYIQAHNLWVHADFSNFISAGVVGVHFKERYGIM
jgi:hypothetical protein